MQPPERISINPTFIEKSTNINIDSLGEDPELDKILNEANRALNSKTITMEEIKASRDELLKDNEEQEKRKKEEEMQNRLLEEVRKKAEMEKKRRDSEDILILPNNPSAKPQKIEQKKQILHAIEANKFKANFMSPSNTKPPIKHISEEIKSSRNRNLEKAATTRHKDFIRNIKEPLKKSTGGSQSHPSESPFSLAKKEILENSPFYFEKSNSPIYGLSSNTTEKILPPKKEEKEHNSFAQLMHELHTAEKQYRDLSAFSPISQEIIIMKQEEKKIEEKKKEESPISSKGIKLCKICKVLPASMAIVPCGHTGLCEKCINDLVTCPFCKGLIKARLKIFIP